MAYAVVSELRALDGLADTSVYPDATLTLAIDYATRLIDGYCGTSFEAKAFDVTLDGDGSNALYVGVLHIRSITAVAFDGVAQNAADFVGRNEGTVVSKAGVFPAAQFGHNVRVQGTAGVTTVPGEDIKWACRTIARQWALELHSRIPSRALSVSSEMGQFEVRAQAGGPGRPTNMPDVNNVLNKPWNKHKPGMGAVFS